MDRMSKRNQKWSKHTIRVTPGLRERLVFMACALDFSYEGVILVSLREFLGEKAKGYRKPKEGTRPALSDGPEANSANPRIWLKVPVEWWDKLIPGARGDEIRTNAGVVRQALRELYRVGVTDDKDPSKLGKRRQKGATNAWRYLVAALEET